MEKIIYVSGICGERGDFLQFKTVDQVDGLPFVFGEVGLLAEHRL
ncbi:hypothetical protein LYSBPC_27430 [Lysinibacillus piscis]|uniref:Uncharacterized protein n=1 Tax=Lysinibacillus piscis TaxID=2518931 RepID=A0ABQ5NNF3_9BACI|nr:hypothetical protein LYSBPC_27430 [Lysinibacillus sp. KH24]